jgi:predicted O-methyltransferase YrrM
VAFPIAIGPREGAALREWVRREGALRTLETGLAHAVSTRFICEGLVANGPAGRHVAIDPYQQSAYHGAGLQALEEAGVREVVEFYEEESQIVLPRLLAEGRRFDVAFIDGNHRFEAVFLDLVYSGRLLQEGGIVFTDDTQLPGVRRAVAFCETNLGWSVEDGGTEGEHEWLVLRTGSQDAFVRPFDQFVEF